MDLKGTIKTIRLVMGLPLIVLLMIFMWIVYVITGEQIQWREDDEYY